MPKGASGAKLTLEVWVETTKNLKRLNEYRVTHHPREGKEPAYTECFLEYVEGEEFQVKGKYNLVDTEDDLRAAFRCDGVEIARTALLRRNKRKTVTFACCYDMQDSKAVTYPLDFGPLETTDDDILAETSSSMGSIELVFEEVRHRQAEFGVPHNASIQTRVVDERQYKIGSTVVAGHSSTSVEPSQLYSGKTKSNSQSYRFLFHYNTRVKLQTLGVIPQDAPVSDSIPPACTQSSGVSDLSGLEEKPGGIVAYENALKRIRDLEEDLRKERSRKRTRREQPGDCIEDAVDLTEIAD